MSVTASFLIVSPLLLILSLLPFHFMLFSYSPLLLAIIVNVHGFLEGENWTVEILIHITAVLAAGRDVHGVSSSLPLADQFAGKLIVLVILLLDHKDL